MGVPTITGALRGSNAPWSWMASNKSSNMRYGSLVGLSRLAGAGPLDVVVFGETITSILSGELIGVNMEGGPEPGLTNFLPTDGTGCTGIAIGSGVGRSHFILSANQALSVDLPYLIPDPAVAGNVIVRPAGSTTPPVARALSYPPVSASEQYVTGEYMQALSVGLAGSSREVICCDATDTVTTAYFVPKSGAHVNPGATKNTPIVYGPAPAACVVTVIPSMVRLEVAPGATKGVRYGFKKGVNATAANTNAATVSVDILAAATTGTLVGTTTTISLAAGEVLAINALAQDTGVGTAEHSQIAFLVQ